MVSGHKERTLSSSRAFYIRALQAVPPVSGSGQWCPAQAREHHNYFEAAFGSVSYMVEPVSDILVYEDLARQLRKSTLESSKSTGSVNDDRHSLLRRSHGKPIRTCRTEHL
jgi:hypothetical protein